MRAEESINYTVRMLSPAVYSLLCHYVNVYINELTKFEPVIHCHRIESNCKMFCGSLYAGLTKWNWTILIVTLVKRCRIHHRYRP